MEKLSEEQRRVVAAIQDGQNVFITGSAGTGKSYILNYLRKYHEGIHITASTGIAAVQVGGVTLHSWASLHLGEDPVEVIVKRINKNKKKKKMLFNAGILAIDEISMLRGDLFDKFNDVLKQVRESWEPFGGLQVVLFGDFLQLPPVVKFDEMVDAHFCFESYAWQEGQFQPFVLKESFRHKDASFLELLDRIRTGQMEDQDVDLLYERCEVGDQDGIQPTIITTHNAQAEEINEHELSLIETEERSYHWKSSGNKQRLQMLERNCLAPSVLKLRIGAQVMMLKNTFQEEGIVNGSLGVVSGFSKEGYPLVEFLNGVEKEIKPQPWTVDEFDMEKFDMVPVATIEQIPLRLSWAITVHKSQGMTLDKIRCQLGKAFAEGQVYVALSRVKTLEGLYLDTFNPYAVRVNPKVVEFYRKLQ